MREVLRQRARSCDGAELAVVPRPRPSPVLDTPGSRAGAPAPALGRGEWAAPSLALCSLAARWLAAY